MKKILIATGGTGGHIYPAMVTADALRARGWEVCFVGKFAAAQSKLTQAGFQVIEINAEGFISRGPLDKLRAFGLLVKNLFVCASAVLRYRPSVILGFGGYSSVPTVLAGVVLGVASMIHEQNADPGKANRILAKFARRVAVTFRDSLAVFPKQKTVWTGCPLRPLAHPRPRAEILKDLGLQEGRTTILVFGGSQGSRVINECFLDMLEGSDANLPFQVIHLTGKGGLDAVKGRYEKLSIPVFFREYTESMSDMYAVADLVIGRSGAGTVTELGLLQIPAVLIPYPYAAGHQVANARVLERLGQAAIIPEKDLMAGILRDKIFTVLQACSSRKKDQERSREEFATDAVERLVSEVERLVSV